MVVTTTTSSPAYTGANFDSNGGCLRHPDVKLSQRMFTSEGKVVYQELMRHCHKCTARQQQQQREILSSNSSTVAAAQASDGSLLPNNNPHLSRSTSRSRSRDVRSKSRDRGDDTPTKHPVQPRSVSKPRQSVWGQVPSQRDRRNNNNTGGGGGRGNNVVVQRDHHSSHNHTTPPPSKKVFDSPFDPKGRCHYHPNISLAKKKLTGGWKVLMEVCPKCVEEKYIQEQNNSSDNRSVGSRRSTKSSDNRSISSRHSTRSDNSRHSNKSDYRSSVVSSTSRYLLSKSSVAAVRSPSAPRSGGRLSSSTTTTTTMIGKKNMIAEKNSSIARYECPFDNQGCCRIHHHVRLAKKKLTGGWKVVQDTCPECDDEGDNQSVDSRNSRLSRKSVTSKGSQKIDVPKSSFASKQNSVVGSNSSSSSGYKRSTNSTHATQHKVQPPSDHDNNIIRTKLEKVHIHADDHSDENSKVRKSREKINKKDKRDKDKNHRRSSYASETSYDNATNASANKSGDNKNDSVMDKGVSSEKAHHKQRALKEYKDLYESSQVVKNMMFVDVHGDPGRYTGDVNAFKMPHGMGNIVYEHGLVQGGKWTNGVLDEGSISSGGTKINRVGVRSIDP